MSEGLDAILAEIRRKFELKRSKILQNAQREANEIIKHAERIAEAEVNKMLTERASRLRSKLIGKALLEVKEQIIKAKQEIFNTIEKKLEDEIKRIVEGKNNKYDYYKVLLFFIMESVKAIDESNIIILANERDANLLKKNLSSIKQKLERELNRPLTVTVSDNYIKNIGGVIVRNAAGTKVYYNTLEGRMKQILEKYRVRINKLLFSEINKMMKGLL
ncbi:MAG: V-type ATP synthase subunit E [Candidatus Njordarchaeia archaeon]